MSEKPATREVFESKLFPGVTIELMKDFGLEDAEEFAAPENNVGNRPRKGSARKRFAGAMLAGDWDFNGETFIRDSKGRTISGRNRSDALILANKMKEKLGQRGNVTIPAMVVSGIKPKCFRSVDSGEKRSGGDLFYCAHVFNKFRDKDDKPEFTDGQKRKLARTLATAARTVWLRLEGKDVANAPGFPTTAQEEFVKKHPGLIDCVAHVFRCDNGDGNERQIQSLVSMAYMAAIMYLGGTMKTDRDEYNERGSEAINSSLMKKAAKFVEMFATGANMDVGHPILTLRKIYQDQIKQAAKGEGKRDRDVILNTLVKAMTCYLDNGDQAVEKSDVAWKPEKESRPRLGGLDVESDDADQDASDAEEEAQNGEEAPVARSRSSARKTRKSKKQTAESTNETEDNDSEDASDEDLDD